MNERPKAFQDYMTDRSKAAMREKAERGILPGCAPLGYKNAVMNGERVIVLDPEIAPKVKRLFELATKKKVSLRKLCAEAEKMGLRSRNGKPFGPSAMKAILENPFYKGMVRYGGILLSGAHIPLIPNETLSAAPEIAKSGREIDHSSN